MEFNFINSKKVQVDTLLYISSKSTHIKKQRKTSYFLLLAILLLATIGLFLLHKFLGTVLFCLSIIAAIVFPRYLRYYYKRSYEKFVDSTYKNNEVNNNIKIYLNEDSILLKNEQVESKCLLNSIESITEIKDYFYIALKSSTYIIFPKEQADDIDSLRICLQDICLKEHIDFNTELDWRWK